MRVTPSGSPPRVPSARPASGRSQTTGHRVSARSRYVRVGDGRRRPARSKAPFLIPALRRKKRIHARRARDRRCGVVAGATAVGRRNARRVFHVVLETRGEAFQAPSGGFARRTRPPTLRRLSRPNPLRSERSHRTVASRPVRALTPPAIHPAPGEIAKMNRAGATDTTTEPSTSETAKGVTCLLYTSPSPRDATLSRMPSSA